MAQIGYLMRYTNTHDSPSKSSEDLTDVAAPRRMRDSNCTEKTVGDAHDSETRQGNQDPELQNSFGAILINGKASWYP